MAETESTAISNTEIPNAEFWEKRRRQIDEATAGFHDVDDLDPKLPSGHAYGIQKSTWLTSEFRRVHRKLAMNITPQDVLDVLKAAGVKNGVLMGLHGGVGYMPEPRATQDVALKVPYTSRKGATKAIAKRWPSLVTRELSQVTRFLDPGDLDASGQPKAVLDVMAPWSSFQELILKEYVRVDDVTQHRLSPKSQDELTTHRLDGAFNSTVELTKKPPCSCKAASRSIDNFEFA